MDDFKLRTIWESWENGNRRQMVEQIDEYGLYDFWGHFRTYLMDLGCGDRYLIDVFTDMTISYFRIKNG